MRFNLKLSHKGLILVSVPLVFELIFVAILYCSLQQAEVEIVKEAHAKAILSHISNVMREMIEAASAIGGYSITGKSAHAEHFEEAIARIPKEFAALEALLKDSPKELESIQRIDALAQNAIDCLHESKELIDDGDRLGAYKRLAQLKKSMRQIGDEADRSVEMWKRIEEASPLAQARARHRLKVFLAIGVAFNVALAVSLALYFNKGTTHRLQILMDNTARLARGQPLNPPLPGGDEIARLDQVFNDMAKALAAAAKKEREITENALAAEARVRMIIETMPVGLIIVNEQGIIDVINPATEEMFGYSFEDLSGQPFGILFAIDSPAPPAANTKFDGNLFFKEISQRAAGRIIDGSALHKDGKTFPVELSLKEFNTLDGTRFLAVILDVTERHEVERLKREFVAMASHELRTPLTSVQGFLTLLGEGAYGELTENGERKVKLADRNISRLIKLINDLLDIEKMEAGKLDMQFEDVSVATVIERSLESVRGFAEKHGVILESGGKEILLHADGDRLIQVLVNLLSNAVKFSEPGGKVTVAVIGAEGAVEVRVIDNGRGIPEKFRQSIFERFQQVDPADSRQKGGAGLGLAICKAIIEQHGGTIGVESEEGNGSTFWFRLPCASEAAGKEASPAT